MKLMREQTGITLNPAQQSVADHALLESGFSVVLQMPTGSGKSWLAKQAIRQSVERGFRAVYLCPLRALADELATQWSEDFGEEPVGVFTGDYGRPGRSLPVSYKDARVLIMTPERLDACTRSWRTHWHWIPEVDWLVVDEIHLLGDGNRGARLEGTISRMRRLNPFLRILGLSATLGNREELADWLDGVELQSEWRPIPLEWTIQRFKKPEEKPDILLSEVSRNLDSGGQSLVFVQSRRRAEQLAARMREGGLTADHHHAGLTHTERRKVEQSFRGGDTPVLIATATLEMGLNLPVRQVVLYDMQGFDGVGFSPLSVNTVWQRAGRAGRPGLDPTGEVVLLAPAWDREVSSYANGRFERIRSQLGAPQTLAEQVLAETHTGLARTRVQLQRTLGGTLASLQGHSLDVEGTIEEMLDAGMLFEDEEASPSKLVATRLGRIACRHQLRPDTILRLRNILESLDELTDFDLLLAAATTMDCTPMLPVDFEELESLAEELSARRTVLFQDMAAGLELAALRGKRLLSAFRCALVMWRWTQLGDLDWVAEEDGCYPFEVYRLIESMDRLLLATAAIQRGIDLYDVVVDEDEEPPPKSAAMLRIELLRQKVLNGIDDPAASLTLVKGIGSSWARKLYEHGIGDLEALSEANPDSLAELPGLSVKRASEWIGQAGSGEMTIPPVIEGAPLRTLPPDTDTPVDPYRLRRALELSVTSAGRGRWQVAGGSEPRQVHTDGSALLCSCPDFAKGNVCKHLLAVRLHRKEPELQAVVQQLTQDHALPYLDLFQLWFDR